MRMVYSRYIHLCRKCNFLSGISIELTNFCNFSCKHCYRIHGDAFISEEFFQSILEQSEQLGAIKVSFNGGEPTLHPSFIIFAESVLSRGMQLDVLTNGSGLSFEVLKKLSTYKNLYVQLSLYGTDSESGEILTGVKHSYERTMLLIENLSSMGYNFRISILPLRDTIDKVPSVLLKLKDNNISAGLIMQLSAREDGDPLPFTFAPTDSQVENIFNEEQSTYCDADELILRDNSPAVKDLACYAGVTTVAVRADGRIVPCQVFNIPVLGHISTDTLASVLAGEARRRFLEANVIPDTCRACDLQRFCMRCPADAMYETGSLTGIPAESCRIARLRAKFHIDSRK